VEFVTLLPGKRIFWSAPRRPAGRPLFGAVASINVNKFVKFVKLNRGAEGGG